MILKSILFSILLALAVPTMGLMASDKCVMCGSGSSNGCQQCILPGGDTYPNRKKCENAGCKISGTTSCSTAANVKVCTGK
ncbi:hypothetical protein [Leptospira sp. GIMC2001]|uniref:hypothetical protein n=1 Tax=Leptospira sp. GIMC2001 TaxID=1513297 RepID=UPI002349E87D|nr:hypothetical protein [Leptospira sp. GIMC2001]WCL48221.1 hypothetical protein O4O04_13000 [Leptospira sp. GIMC2001]